jgi:exonuclease SbcC
MRPLELTVEGFRSYRTRTTFDWRGRRLVGIVGPIGSGKSSILDAVSFALYGKTPAVEGATKSLIHQLCDASHVELRFEVDGQVWRAVRSLRRKGQSGHQLERLADDRADADVLDRVTGDEPMKARVEQLLGMDFKAFCRSVMLAQNRFAEFLKATAGDRDRVLKGVFGYDLLDAAQATARVRLERAELELEVLAGERRRIDEARERLEGARAAAARAERRLRDLESLIPEFERLTKETDAATADAVGADELIAELRGITETLPSAAHVDEVVRGATEADSTVESARAAVDEASRIRAERDAELHDVAARVGDRERFRSFDRLVQQQEHEAATAERARQAVARCEGAVTLAEEAAADARARASEAADVAEPAVRASLASAEEELERRRAALAQAQHAEMAQVLRGELSAGDRCPVCDQPIHQLPKRGAAPKVATAERAVAKAATGVTRAQRDVERAARAASAAQGAAEGAEAALKKAHEHASAAMEELRAAEAALAATQGQLVEWLGEGDARTLLEAREAELDGAEHAARAARAELDAAQSALEEARELATHSAKQLSTMANRLSVAWGRLGEDRAVAADPVAARAGFLELGEAVLSRHADAQERRRAAQARAAEAGAALETMLGSIGLDPGADFRHELTQAGIRHGAAATEVAALEEQVGRSNRLEGQIVEAEARHGLVRRLAEDLKPSRFLAFLLQEERAELAELGSEHFEQLTDGAYRFTEDDRFEILDLNAAGTKRKPDSLSGGETFLASLALALALAEMVARGGGRLDAFFLDEGFGSLDPEHLDRAMDGIGRLVSEDARRLVVLVSHVAEMREAVEDLIVLDKHDVTGDTIVRSGAAPAA